MGGSATGVFDGVRTVGSAPTVVGPLNLTVQLFWWARVGSGVTALLEANRQKVWRIGVIQV